MSIQRWLVSDLYEMPDDYYNPLAGVVTYADHVAAVQAAVQRATDRYNAEHVDDRLAAFENGAASERERIRKVVEGLPWAFVDPPGVLDTILAVIDGEASE